MESLKEYVLSFSSFYKAAYGQDMLEEEGIFSTMKKLPTELVRSCSTGLYLRTNSIQDVEIALEKKGIVPLAMYLIVRTEDGKKMFKKVG